MTCSLLGITLSPTVSILTMCLIPLCITNAVLRVATTKLTAARCPRDEFGAQVGFGQTITSVARMLSPALGGAAQEISVLGPGLLGTACAAVTTSFSLLYMKNK